MSELGKIGIVEEMPCGRIRQIGLTADQKRMLELSLVPIAKMTSANALVGMPPDQDLILKRDANQWIDVNDRLPEKSGRYMVAYQTIKPVKRKYTSVDIDSYDEKERTWEFFHSGIMQEVTHWMPLPKPPSEVNHGK